ncbi:MAG: NUDIX hydrolase [Chloroflexaceae bacterium]|nr:NUDIX hydrolase [Chloroflexaceae bacterium]
MISLPASLAHQIEPLTRHYGSPLSIIADLSRRDFEPLNKTDRIGEVCMVIRRPDGRLITAIKTTSPLDAYRIPTGGIKPDEDIESALLRETFEETSLDVTIRRFLAVIQYRLTPLYGNTSDWTFYTFVFLLDEIGGHLHPSDPSEKIADYRMVWPTELLNVAETLYQSTSGEDPTFTYPANSWGAFRSIVHQVIYHLLTDTVAALTDSNLSITTISPSDNQGGTSP